MSTLPWVGRTSGPQAGADSAPVVPDPYKRPIYFTTSNSNSIAFPRTT